MLFPVFGPYLLEVVGVREPALRKGGIDVDQFDLVPQFFGVARVRPFLDQFADAQIS